MSQELLTLARSRSKIMDSAITKYGSFSLMEYTKHFTPYIDKPLQPADDFRLLAFQYNEDLLGFDIAVELDKALHFSILNTANHHGVDFFPPSVQGNLLFWQVLKNNGFEAKYLPVCSFGIVSLSNSSYARGITSYVDCKKTLKIPVFPKSIENKMVRYVPGFTEEQVFRAINKTKEEAVNIETSKVIIETLEKYYLNQNVIEKKFYKDQAVLINMMLTKEMFKGEDMPQVVYMEMEQILKRLLIMDLEDIDSVLYRIMYDKKIIKELINQMGKEDSHMSTMFFWGRDEEDRRFPLNYCNDGIMRGKTLRGEEISLSSDRKSLIKMIKEERILPSGYTVAIMLCFARGYTWLGGYFQGDYLPKWQEKTILALKAVPEYEQWAEKISKYDCSGYISGPLYAMNMTEDGLLGPSGPIEILQSGGMSKNKFEKLLNASVLDAHYMGLYGSYPDLIPKAERKQNWSKKLGEELSEKYRQYAI